MARIRPVFSATNFTNLHESSTCLRFDSCNSWQKSAQLSLPRISLFCTNFRILSFRFVQFVAESRADGLLDPVAVPVVHIAGGDAPGHRSQPVLGVVCVSRNRDGPGRFLKTCQARCCRGPPMTGAMVNKTLWEPESIASLLRLCAYPDSAGHCPKKIHVSSRGISDRA